MAAQARTEEGRRDGDSPCPGSCNAVVEEPRVVGEAEGAVAHADAGAEAIHVAHHWSVDIHDVHVPCGEVAARAASRLAQGPEGTRQDAPASWEYVADATSRGNRSDLWAREWHDPSGCVGCMRGTLALRAGLHKGDAMGVGRMGGFANRAQVVAVRTTAAEVVEKGQAEGAAGVEAREEEGRTGVAAGPERGA